MKRRCGCGVGAVVAVAALAGCGTWWDGGGAAGGQATPPALRLPRGLEDQILAIDARRVTRREVDEVLSRAPAPQVVNIHGGIHPVYRRMIRFSKFLAGMGYPAEAVKLPCGNRYSFSCYEPSERIAGAIAWFHERDGMRPMIVGHSQGGMQAVKVLHDLDSYPLGTIAVWNPCTRRMEPRHEIVDPLTGARQGVVGTRVSLTVAIGAGGATRVLPNQWSMNFRLRSVPDSTEEFLGFYMPMDVLGGDMLGFGPLNEFHATGRAQVRNVRLPDGTDHGKAPEAHRLLENRQFREWLDAYDPARGPTAAMKAVAPGENIVFAAEVWYAVRKHWVLELQRAIRARRAGGR